MNYENVIKAVGCIDALIEYTDGSTKVIEFHNTLVRTGRAAMAAALTNAVSKDFNLYVNRMIFGDGGTVGGVLRFVNSDRNGLFGITRASKPVIAQVDANNNTQATFTSVITFQEANGFTLNEMALQLATGDLYSMATFPDLNKTSQMQITWNWRLSFV
jgi:hypothetical protein